MGWMWHVTELWVTSKCFCWKTGVAIKEMLMAEEEGGRKRVRNLILYLWSLSYLFVRC